MQYFAGSTSVQYRLDVSAAMLAVERLKQAMNNIVPNMYNNIDWSKDYTEYSKLTPVEKRKMLRKMEKKIAVKDMSYEQAKLYHRLKGRIDK